MKLEKQVLEDKKIPVGISQCLMGDKVRYDGGHKRSDICMGQLSQFFEFIPTCPELAIGMGVPRPTIHLVQKEHELRLLEVKDHKRDYTQAMQSYARRRGTELEHICGYVLAKASPTCGMERVKVYSDTGHALNKDGVGMFAAYLMQHRPNLPLEEDGRLNDSLLRDNFIFRVYIYHAWQRLQETGLDYHKLYTFHARVKYALMAHSYDTYRALGKFIAESANKKIEVGAIKEAYFSQLMQAFKRVVQRQHHKNTLLHILGYFKKDIDPQERQILLQQIEDFAAEKVPLGVPMALIHLFLEKYPKPYLQDQYYLFPYPKALSKRNFI